MKITLPSSRSIAAEDPADQPSPPPRAQRTRYVLVVGLDFGTSFSKVVVQEQAQKVAQTVTFSGNQYLFPSIIGYHAGALEGPFSAPLKTPLPYLKMQLPVLVGTQVPGGQTVPRNLQALMGNNPQEEARNLLAWYLANVLSATRYFIQHESRWQDFDFSGSGTKDKLIAQVCIPVGYMNDNCGVRCFHDALALAYLLMTEVPASMAGSCERGMWRQMCESSSGQIATIRETSCFTFPEVAAGVQGILRSPTAEDGLYLTVDVGAGTVDMNAFRRYTAQRVLNAEERPNRLDYYAAKVAPYGVARIAECRQRNPFQAYEHITWDADAQLALGTLPETDVMFRVERQVTDLYHSAQQFQRNHGTQKGLRTWDECKIYAWGGGYEYDPYRRALVKALAKHIHGAEILSLPQPGGLSLPRAADYQRLSIAYGLSFLIANLEDIRLPQDLKPSPLSERRSALPQFKEKGYWTEPGVDGEYP